MKKIVTAVVIIAFLTGSHLCAEGVDLRKFVQETQKLNQGANSFQLVWWIPTEYWKESFRNVPNITDEQKKTLYMAVDDYIVLRDAPKIISFYFIWYMIWSCYATQSPY